MRFIDDHNPYQPDFFIELDLEQTKEKIHSDILEFCNRYKPEVLVAEALEADYVIDILPQLALSYGGLILKHPTRSVFPLGEMSTYVQRMPNSRYSVRFVLSPMHSQYHQIQQLFVTLDEDIDIETHIQELHSTYFLIGMNEGE